MTENEGEKWLFSAGRFPLAIIRAADGIKKLPDPSIVYQLNHTTAFKR